MPKFVFAYFGRPNFANEEEGSAHMQEWRDWLAGLGETVVDPGMPIAPGTTISANGISEGNSGPSSLSGITVVDAPSMERAEEMARTCPHLGGTRLIHIAPAMEMP